MQNKVTVRLETACGCKQYMLNVSEDIAYRTLQRAIFPTDSLFWCAEPESIASINYQIREFEYYRTEHDDFLNTNVCVMREIVKQQPKTIEKVCHNCLFWSTVADKYSSLYRRCSQKSFKEEQVTTIPTHTCAFWGKR